MNGGTNARRLADLETRYSRPEPSQADIDRDLEMRRMFNRLTTEERLALDDLLARLESLPVGESIPDDDRMLMHAFDVKMSGSVSIW